MKQFTTLGFLAGMLLMSGCSTSVESQFKKACRDGGGNRTFCSCLYEQVSGHYGKERFDAIATGKRQLPNDYNEKVMEITYHCASKQL
ncbi:hypothetical protein QTA56_07875 [Acinetobacter sp. VNH17]|uniref:Lipoprotein n=1 Tax=Acinetobacter thutiue TaxID=2998078 RepID=A0ABT7WN97_9GAMM|nr:hypothetical protein [Acinetobacter thutiue]MCY6412050.1 hypothetical protein [Acinetobacter thutiue]MDN0014154.1 hypothetical protein [Acinetobacter thutiue]